MIAQSTIDNIQKGEFKTKFKSGKYYIPVRIKIVNKPPLSMELKFGFDRVLLDQVKQRFEKRKWNPDNKT